MQNVAALIQVLHELRDAAAVVELVRLLRLFALVLDRDANAFVEKRFFAQSLGQFFETEFSRIENLRVRFESNLRTALSRLARLLQTCDCDAPLVVLFVRQAIAP